MPEHMPTAYIALGANLPSPAGVPAHTFDAAIARLAELGQVTARSGYYSTAPVGYADQPMFLNAAVALDTDLDPRELLYRLLAMERDFGRDRSHSIANGPRMLDLDLILYGDTVLDTPELQLPHPRMHERLFVLDPLCEIAPDVVHPILEKSVTQLKNQLSQ